MIIYKNINFMHKSRAEGTYPVGENEYITGDAVALL
jgi:hypothetical protein